MKVSVICPLYNSLPYIRATIDSLKAQTMSDFEVLIVDDHSIDGSLQAAKDHTKDDARFRFIQTPRNCGPGVARNIGIEAAQGEYITFIDSDDMYHHDFLRCLSDSIQGGKDMAYCQLQYLKDGSLWKIHYNPIVPDGDFTEKAKKNFLKHFVTFSVCFMYRKDFLRNNHLRFPEISHSEDTNFLIKSIILAKTIACINEPLYLYNVHQGSLTTRRNIKKSTERLRSLTSLVKEFGKMKSDSRLAGLQLDRYNSIILYLWFKKGLILSIIDLIKQFI